VIGIKKGKLIGLWLPVYLLFLSVSAGAAENWIADELLKQMSDLRLELAALKSRVSSLEQRAGANTPTPARVALALSGYALGAEDAPIAIVEFSDFQCGYCKRHHKSTFRRLQDNAIAQGQVRYYARDFPLDNHPTGIAAATAARCAGEQGLYWPMRDKLFSTALGTNQAGSKGDATLS